MCVCVCVCQCVCECGCVLLSERNDGLNVLQRRESQKVAQSSALWLHNKRRSIWLRAPAAYTRLKRVERLADSLRANKMYWLIVKGLRLLELMQIGPTAVQSGERSLIIAVAP